MSALCPLLLEALPRSVLSVSQNCTNTSAIHSLTPHIFWVSPVEDLVSVLEEDKIFYAFYEVRTAFPPSCCSPRRGCP